MTTANLKFNISNQNHCKINLTDLTKHTLHEIMKHELNISSKPLPAEIFFIKAFWNSVSTLGLQYN